MQASTVKISKETQEKLKSGLTAKQKRKLKTKHIKDYIRSKPAGTLIETRELVAVAGYDVNSTAKLSSGYAFVNRLVKKGIIASHVDESKRGVSWSVPGDSKTIKKKTEPGKSITRTTDTPPSTSSSTLDFALEAEAKAKEFAWRKDSDSVREFIKWLKGNL